MRTLLITLPIALVATAFTIAASGQAPAPRGLPSIAYISPQRVGVESTASKADVAKFQALQTQKTNELRAKQQMLEATRAQLPQADPAKRNALLQEEQRERIDLERATVQANTDLQNFQRQIQVAFQSRLKSAVEDLMKGGPSYQIILNADTGLIWAAPGATIDLTNAVVEKMNAPPPEAPKP